MKWKFLPAFEIFLLVFCGKTVLHAYEIDQCIQVNDDAIELVCGESDFDEYCSMAMINVDYSSPVTPVPSENG